VRALLQEFLLLMRLLHQRVEHLILPLVFLLVMGLSWVRVYQLEYPHLMQPF
jgi:hypothetical protein